jgi:hypothetical protein
MSAGHRQEIRLPSDFIEFRKGECNGMKTLSVLFTLALFIAADRLAAHLKRTNALPANIARPAGDAGSTGNVSILVFKSNKSNNETF